MSKHKDEKHRHHESGAEWSFGHDDLGLLPRPNDPAQGPIELSPGEGVATSASEESALREQVASKDKEIAELKDKYLRALADTR